MTVARMEAEMSNAEFVEWQVFHARKAQRAELEQKMAKHRR